MVLSANEAAAYKLPWPEPEIPEYRAGGVGEWALAPTPGLRYTAGYFLPCLNQPPGWVITHGGEGVWMSLTRMEIESHMPHLAAARGRVVVMGLGMGFALYNIARKPEIERVTIVERDPDMLELLNRTTDWQDWPGIEKVEFVIGDALLYEPQGEVDFLYADIWPHLGDERALADTQAMQARVRARSVGFWGQEWDYLDWMRNNKVAGRFLPHIGTYRRFAKFAGLPLIEQDNPRYPGLAFAAVTLQLMAGSKDPESRRKLAICYERYLLAPPIDPIGAALSEILHV